MAYLAHLTVVPLRSVKLLHPLKKMEKKRRKKTKQRKLSITYRHAWIWTSQVRCEKFEVKFQICKLWDDLYIFICFCDRKKVNWSIWLKKKQNKFIVWISDVEKNLLCRSLYIKYSASASSFVHPFPGVIRQISWSILRRVVSTQHRETEEYKPWFLTRLHGQFAALFRRLFWLRTKKHGCLAGLTWYVVYAIMNNVTFASWNTTREVLFVFLLLFSFLNDQASENRNFGPWSICLFYLLIHVLFYGTFFWIPEACPVRMYIYLRETQLAPEPRALPGQGQFCFSKTVTYHGVIVDL